jgi:hypothetical protein
MADTSVPVEFLFELTLNAAPDPRTMVAGGPHGTRGAVTVAGGSFAGPRLQGEVLPPGGDWLLRRANDTLLLDVRISLLTDDGANIFMQYKGIGSATVDAKRKLWTAPLFETGDERYAWLNDLQAVGIGEADVTVNLVRYNVYALL